MGALDAVGGAWATVDPEIVKSLLQYVVGPALAALIAVLGQRHRRRKR
jgi:hypothetical protein